MDMGKNTRPIFLWLLIIYLLVCAMVTVGGITRLTRSGLSIVEWRPITGILPPLNQKEWEEEFQKYRKFPEYKKVNRRMNLAEFKNIFFWEYVHRLLGRVIGLLVLLPFLYFLIRKRLDKTLIRRVVILFVLGGLQGLMGWYMVKSGLVNMPRVSHYRLAAHLLIAFAILSYLIWMMTELATGRPVRLARVRSHPVFRHVGVLIVLLFVQIIYGAFTAGLRAGSMFNTFPLMGSGLVPPGIFGLQPFLANFTENPATVQFIHRVLAWILLFYTGAFTVYAYPRIHSQTGKIALFLLSGGVLLQFLVGVMTLLAAAPPGLGALHQTIAALLWSAVFFLAFRLEAKSPE